MRIFILLSLIAIMTSCLKEELPVPKHDYGDVEITVVDIKNDYPIQAFFSLSKGQVTAQNTKDDWDFGFENGENGTHIIINYSRNMFIYATGKENMEDVLSPSGYLGTEKQRFDSPYGEYDSLAMRHYEDGLVRIVDLGHGVTGEFVGWHKIKVLEVTQTDYTIELAPLTSTESTITVIPKQNNGDYQFTYYSLKNNSVVDIAPADNDWDLVFTQFTERLYQPLVMPYLVTGTLLSRKNTKGTRLVNVDFDNIDLSYAQALVLSDTMNVIGYDWKSFDFDDEDYTVYTNICYVIQDANGVYYKLKFLDFYSPTGEKGYNKFLLQSLGE